jgi:CheY-like chemotaxis protein
VFTARLALPPAAAPAIAAAPVAADPAAPAEESQLRIRILAAEDNHTNQLVLKTLLEQLGISIHVVENGEEAVAAWRASAWDLVLMDINMPLMDGLTATRTIRAIEAAEGRPRTPIIAVTANATASQAAEYVDAGMDGLVPKPIHFSQLLAAIAGAMDAENDNQALGQTSVA